MKLVEILARELEVWPEGAQELGQWPAGEICIRAASTGHPCTEVYTSTNIADDVDAWCTRPQWQAERDRMKTMESIELKDTEGLREALKDCDAAGKPMGDWVTITEPTVSYEQELWDRAALGAPVMIFEAAEGNMPLVDMASHVARWADAFMAERAKRVGK